jgi:hypothetical protein
MSGLAARSMRWVTFDATSTRPEAANSMARRTPDRRRAGHDVAGLAYQFGERVRDPPPRVDLTRRINLLDTGVRSDHDRGWALLAIRMSAGRLGVRGYSSRRAGENSAKREIDIVVPLGRGTLSGRVRLRTGGLPGR